VHCQRTWRHSLLSRNFLDPQHRQERLDAIACWRPRQYAHERIDYNLRAGAELSTFIQLLAELLALPFRFISMRWFSLLKRVERPVIVPLTAWLADFFERHYIVFNFISNPLINLGIVFELALCCLFFYTPLARVYYFAPVPWHVYLFALNGTFLLFAFEETKKYYRRKGYRLDFFG
jgi:hypothetical protein